MLESLGYPNREADRCEAGRCQALPVTIEWGFYNTRTWTLSAGLVLADCNNYLGNYLGSETPSST